MELLPLRIDDPQEKTKALDLAIEYRKATLKKRVDALTSLGDIGRALVLQEWVVPTDVLMLQEWQGSTEPKDREVYAKRLTKTARYLDDWNKTDEAKLRTQLVERFGKGIKQALASGDPVAQVAACMLIVEGAANARKTQPFLGELRKMFTGLAPDLMVLTGSSNPDIRAAAVQALGMIRPAPRAAVAELKKALANDSDAKVRRAAGRALDDLLNVLATPIKAGYDPRAASGGFALDEDSTLLARLLEQENLDEWRLASAEVLDAATTLPGHALFDSDDLVRQYVAAAAGRVGASFKSQLPDPDGAAANLVRYPPSDRPLSKGEIAIIENDRKFARLRVEYYKPLLKALLEAAPALAQATTDSRLEAQLSIRQLLQDVAAARFRLRRTLENIPLIPKEKDKENDKEKDLGRAPLRDRSTTVKLAHAALGQEGFVSVALLVEQEKADADTEIDPLLKEPAVTLNALAQGVSTGNVPARVIAIDALDMMGSEAAPAIPALVRALCDMNRFVRWAAARTLGHLAPREADMVVPGLVALLKDPDTDVRVAAAVALERFGPAARGAVSALGQAAGQGDSEVRIAAIKALMAIGREAAPAVPEIARGLEQDNNIRLRKQAADALGQFGPLAESAIPELLKALEDPEADVRRAAAAALLKIRGR
jgi:HEAT repeat protein